MLIKYLFLEKVSVFRRKIKVLLLANGSKQCSDVIINVEFYSDISQIIYNLEVYDRFKVKLSQKYRLDS